ncbi:MULTISPECIES: hypothetical protein [unclassified Bradyrhizobium]
MTLLVGEKVCFVLDRVKGGKQSIPLAHPERFAAAHPGQDPLIDDAGVRLSVLVLGMAKLTLESLSAAWSPCVVAKTLHRDPQYRRSPVLLSD